MFQDNSDIKDLIPVPEVMNVGDLIPDLIPVDTIPLDLAPNLTIYEPFSLDELEVLDKIDDFEP